MRYGHGNPAARTADQLGGLMGFVAMGAVQAAGAAREVMLERREASIFQSYADALTQAQTYAYEIAAVAEVAVARVTELEAEVARLKSACRQRQEVIDTFRKVAA